MPRSRKGPPNQAKHFQKEDHAHAAHQDEAAHGHMQKPGEGDTEGAKRRARVIGHPQERTPRGPRRGQ